MTHKSVLLGVIFAATLAVSIPSLSTAQDQEAGPREQRYTEEQRDTPGEYVQRDSVGGGVLNISRVPSVEERRQEIRERIETQRADVREKLTGKRAEACKNQEKGINQALDSRALAAERYLGKFKAVETRLTDFVAANSLEVTSLDTYKKVLGDRYNEALDLITIAQSTDFTCEDASASNPGEVVKGLVQDTKSALAEYRTAVKDYAEAIRQTAVVSQQEGQQDAQE